MPREPKIDKIEDFVFGLPAYETIFDISGVALLYNITLLNFYRSVKNYIQTAIKKGCSFFIRCQAAIADCKN